MRHSLCVLLILSMVIMSFGIDMNIIYKWKYCVYKWLSQKQMKDAMKSGTYDPYKCFLFDADKAKDGRLFFTAPKLFGPGSPATLATVTNETGPGGPLLQPYPDWSWHNRSCMCDGIINVLRVNIRCNHLFALDSGTIGSDQICNPKLLIFNLENDTLVKTIYIPLDIATNQTGSGLLVDIHVYIPGECTQFLDTMIVFMADIRGKGLIVYNSSTKKMCRIESDYMKPTDGIASIVNQTFPFDGGIFNTVTFRDDLYYVSTSGNNIYKIKINALLECPNKERANKQTKRAIKIPSDSAEVASAGHSIFYGDSDGAAIMGTNVFKKPGKNTVILAQDNENLQGISSIKVAFHWNRLTCLTDKFHRYALGTVNINEINFRYLEMNLAEVLKKMD